MIRIFLKVIIILIFVPGFVTVAEARQDNDTALIRSWQLRGLYTEKQGIEIDTAITSFQVHNPVFRKSISSSYLGNAGLAAKSNIFSERGPYSDFIFVNHFQVYHLPPSETKFYNTRRPFSLIDFSTGGPRGMNEKMLDILHTQNVNPDFNLGFRYFNINSDGQYQGNGNRSKPSNQAAVTNAITLFSSLELDDYEMHASISLNSARVFENGGLVDDAVVGAPQMETVEYPVRLQNVRNGINNNSFFLSHSWKPFFHSPGDTISSSGSRWFRGIQLYHVLKFDQFRRTYLDAAPSPDFYSRFLINREITNDSVYYRSFINMLMVQLPSFSRGIVSFDAKGGLKNELIKGSYNIPIETTYNFIPVEDPGSYLFAQPADTIIKDRQEHKYSSNAIIATARGNIGDVFTIWGEGNLFFHGYKQGEYDITAGIRFDFFEGKNRSVIEAGARQRELKPSFFHNTFSSNHFAWRNDFRLTGESSLRGLIGMPERGFNAGISFHLLNNFVYFDETANPRQHTEVFPVMNISLGKDFNLWKFHFRNIVKYQVSGNKNVLPLPDIAVYQSTWFEQSLIRDVLNMQIGLDVYYTTEYQGYAYQPATSQFYLQNERMLGNYPYLDVFINFKHKRTRVFFKAEHINSGQMGPEYFTVLHYPRNERVLKFGLSWSFYN
jgi:hypothetical protein